jgi:hypothetical protein
MEHGDTMLMLLVVGMWKKKKARMISMTPMSLFDNDVFSSFT